MSALKNIKKNIIKKVMAMSLLIASGLGYASDDPVLMLQKVADKMIVALEANQKSLKSNPAIIRGIVDEVLLPCVDANRMSGMVVGRSDWMAATPAERQAFVEQFKKVVVSTYSGALASYDKDKVQIYPLRGQWNNQQYIQVESMILRKSGQKIGITYHLVKNANTWKVYDFSIEGVSIVQNYQSQFSSTLAQGGLKALLAKLQDYNKK